MDHSNVVDVLIVNFPEIILIILLGMALVGCYDKVTFKDKKSIIRLIATSLILSVINVPVRYFASSVLEVLIISVVLYTLATWLILKVEWYKALVGILLSTLISIVTLEILYMPLAMTITKANPQMIYSNSLLRFLFSFPERMIQAVVVYFLFKKRVKLINLSKIDNLDKFSKLKLSLIAMLVFCIMLLVGIYGKIFMFSNALLENLKLVMLATLGFVIIAVIVMALVFTLYKTSRQVIEQGEKHYITVQEYSQKLINIYTLISDGNVEKVKKLIESDINIKNKI